MIPGGGDSIITFPPSHTPAVSIDQVLLRIMDRRGSKGTHGAQVL